MSDPRRVKLTGNLVAKVKFNKTGEVLDLCKKIDDTYKSIPTELAEEEAKKDIEKISDKPNTTLYRITTSFSYVEKDVLKDFDYGNVLVEAYLPYCFLIPNFTDLVVSIPEFKLEALLTSEKIWTNRAQT